MAKNPDIVPLGERTGTLEEKYRTCNYCHIPYRTKEAFREHWDKCPHRIDQGLVKGIRRKEKGTVTLTLTAAQANTLYDVLRNNHDREVREQRVILQILKEAVYERD